MPKSDDFIIPHFLGLVNDNGGSVLGERFEAEGGRGSCQSPPYWIYKAKAVSLLWIPKIKTLPIQVKIKYFF